ncbi:kinase-like domain-containing protein [Clohesyomyces aquaticus]|uniref:non-specific serine/threonine protein kinase n=1 Tax=Clohesyomyces aquaticus TaxID=1231657 RepID=A0A1Y1ZCP3_9PLEO|nr:kinase-like domain-containing protein [Clohesyomyces aquaticus]
MADDFGDSERGRYNRFPDDEKDGYMEYRREKLAEKGGAPGRWGWRIAAKWEKLGLGEKQPYVDRAAAGGADDEGGQEEGEATGSDEAQGSGAAEDGAGEADDAEGQEGEAVGTDGAEGAEGENADVEESDSNWAIEGAERNGARREPSEDRKLGSARSFDETVLEGTSGMPRNSEHDENDLEDRDVPLRKRPQVPRYSNEPRSSEERSVLSELKGGAPQGSVWRWERCLLNRENEVSISVYVLVDSDGRVEDRIVLKRMEFEDLEFAEAHPEAENMTRLPKECTAVLHIRGYNFDKDRDRPALCLYTDFAPSGDLRRLHDQYGKIHPKSRIPEPFIWYTFLQLSEAIYVLNTGSCKCNKKLADTRPETIVEDGWKPIIHKDMKDENVFLGSPEKPCRSYPRPLLADFGLSMDRSNVEYWLENEGPDVFKKGGGMFAGTLGWHPPELVLPELKWDVSHKVDIWGIGVVIWQLMHHTLGDKLEGIRDNAEGAFRFLNADTFPSEDILASKAHIYSHRLHSLVKDCLKKNPRDRPDFYDLRRRAGVGFNEIHRVVGNFQGQEGGGTLPKHLRLHYTEDPYPEEADADEVLRRRRLPDKVLGKRRHQDEEHEEDGEVESEQPPIKRGMNARQT